MQFQLISALLVISSALGFVPFSPLSFKGSRTLSTHRVEQKCTNSVTLTMKLGEDEKVIVIGVAADSGCGKSTFMRRLTKVFGGKNVGPLGGGFGAPGG